MSQEENTLPPQQQSSQPGHEHLMDPKPVAQDPNPCGYGEVAKQGRIDNRGRDN